MRFLNLKESVTGLAGLVLSSAFKLNQPSNMRDWYGRKDIFEFSAFMGHKNFLILILDIMSDKLPIVPKA